MDIQKIIKEDILRILYEEGEGIFPKELFEKIIAPDKEVLNAIEELISEELIENSSDKAIKYTPKGKIKGEEIFKKHIVIENYFIENRTEAKAHSIAHILEHYISEEVILNLKLIDSYKNQGIPLLNSDAGYEYFITDIGFNIGDNIFERLASMDIYPGKKIIVSTILQNCIILGIGNKKVAIDKSIAKEVKVY